MKRIATELSNSLTGTEKENFDNQNSSQLVERQPIEGTPFHLVILENKEDECFIGLGNYRLNTPTTKQNCLQQINDRDYNMILALINAIHHFNTHNPIDYQQEDFHSEKTIDISKQDKDNN